MDSTRHYLMGFAAWETCVIGFFLASLAWTGTHIWSKNDFIWIVELSVCGMIVVAITAKVSGRFRRIGGTVAGMFFGLLPSLCLLAWVHLARPGFEESAGGAGVAYMLVIPCLIGGALAGIICSRPTKSV